MPIFTFRCERCGRPEDRFYTSWEQMVKEPAVRCLKDGSRMERVPTAPAFTVDGFNAKNGYAKDSQ